MRNYTLFFLFSLCMGNALQAQLANWTAYNPSRFPINRSGQIHGQARISQMKFHPSNPNKMYAITAQGGLFISNDQANSWAVASGTDAINSHFASICIDHTDDQVLYLGGGDANYFGSGTGMYKSTNGGNTFVQYANAVFPTGRLVLEILMHPTNRNVIVAATNGGIYRTTNGGTTWTAVTSTSLVFCDMHSVANAGSMTLYASTNTVTPAFYRSTDFGGTWTQINAGITAPVVNNIQSGSRIAVSPADTNVVYFGMVSSGGMIFKSIDKGLNFTLMKDGGSPYLTYYADDVASSGQGNYNFAIGVDRLDANKIWLQSHNTWYSSNSGTSWTKLHDWWEKCHTDMHQIEKSPYDNTKLYSCNDGGVWLSTDEGSNWTPKSDGIFAFEIPALAGKTSPTRRDFVSIGTQDNGEVYADSTGWYTIRGGDDYTNREIDKRPNSAAVYYIGDEADFSVSSVGERRLSPTGGKASFGSPLTIIEAMAFNRSNTNLSFIGDVDVYRSTNVLAAGPTWTKISNFNTTIMAIHSAIADPNRLYVITIDQKIYVSSDALSANPTFTSYNLPALSNTRASIAAICNNANTVYIAINNRIYRSADGGQTWANITFNLPNVNHRRILAEEYYGTDELVFVATSNAVFYKKATQNTWTNYSTNLPARRSPTELSIFDDGTDRALIRYKSFGRAVWQTPFDNLRSLKPVFETAAADPCAPNIVRFQNLSLGDPTSFSWSFPGASPSTSNAENPVVTFPGAGSWPVIFTITDASASTRSITTTYVISNMTPCAADTIPGQSLVLNTNADYAVVPALNITTNTITMSGWVKPDGVQSSTVGLIFSASNSATGLHLSNGSLSYHWNDEAGSYNFVAGAVPPNVWSHVALVVNGTSAVLYVNGVPSTRTATHIAVNFNAPFQLGRDRTNTSRNFIGQMDEVCIYNRALSTNEIRLLMHLTKNYGTTDASLVRYYQMNEPSGIILDHSGSGAHATLEGAPTRMTSTAPVGSGVSERQTINTSGNKIFAATGLELEFPSTGALPNGDLVAFRLNVAPDQKPSVQTSPSSGYWIINNYGTNPNFAQLSSIKFKNLPNVATGFAAADFGMFKRSSVADGNTWGTLVDRGDVFAPNGSSSSVTFSTGNSITNLGQFILSTINLDAGPDQFICNGSSANIGTASPGYTFVWSPATGLSSTTIGNPVASPTSTTLYSVTATHTSTGTTLTDEVLVTVAPTSVTVTASANNVCAGTPVTLTATGGLGVPNSTVTLGTESNITSGNSSTSTLGPNPLQNYYGGSKQQMLVLASELRALGMRQGSSISSVSFNLNTGLNTYALNSLQAKIQHTSLSSLSTIVTTGWTNVRAAADYTPSNGWNAIPFINDFVWNGTSNLLLEVNFSNNNRGSSGNTALFSSTTFVSTLLYRVDDATAVAVDAYSAAPTFSYSARNNMQFAFSNPTAYAWSPTATLNAVTGTNVVATPLNTTTYTVTATSMGCSVTGSSTVNVQSVTAVISGLPSGCGSVAFTASGGNTYQWSGGNSPTTASNTFLSSGTYQVTAFNSSGCTATSSVNVTISNGTSNTMTATACGSYTWSANGQTYTSSGSYVSTSTNANGCVNTATLNVTINNGTSNTTTTTACGSYTWSVNGQTYTSSGSYVSTSTNANGCVNTATLNVTINNGTSNTTTATACGSYTWLANGQTYTSSGSYVATSTNANGCVNTATLNVTISNGTSNTTTATACASYTWSANGQTYTSSGSYVSTSTNANGCVNTATLNVTINNGTSNTTTATACGSYTWSANGQTYTSGGSYSNVNGCNTEVLQVTITPNVNATTTVVTCDSYAWSINGQTYTSSGIYVFTSGCSTQTLVLTINNSPNPSIVPSNGLSFCPGASTNLTVLPSGNTYHWSTGSSTQVITVNSSGAFVVTVTAPNNCTAVASVQTTITDTQLPSISCPGTQSIVATGLVTLPNYIAMATATDNCSGVTVTQMPAPGTVYTTNGLVNVTLTARDASANASTCTFAVNVTVTTGQAYTRGGDLPCDYKTLTTLGPVPASNGGTTNCFSVLGNNIGATLFNDPTSCSTPGDKGVFYHFRMPSCGTTPGVRISTNNAGTGLVGTNVAVYTVTNPGSCAYVTYQLVACSGSSTITGCSGASGTAGNGTLEFAQGALVEGGSYYIYVSGDNGTEGNFELTFEYIQNAGISVTAGATAGEAVVTMPNNGQSQFKVQWRPVGSTGWATSPLLTGLSYTLPANSLMPGVSYEFKALYQCAGTNWVLMSSDIVNYATAASGTCARVSGLSCNNVAGSVTTTWSPVPAGTSSRVTVALRNGATNFGGTTVASTVTSVAFANRPNATSMQVQSSCGGAAYIAYSNCAVSAAGQAAAVQPVTFEYNGITYEGIDFNDPSWGLFGAQPEGDFTMSVANGQLIISDESVKASGFDFELRPSMATDFTNVVIRTDKAVDAQLSLSDMNGRLLHSQSLKQAQNGTVIMLETSNFAAGLYIVSVRTEEGNVAKKLVVVK